MFTFTPYFRSGSLRASVGYADGWSPKQVLAALVGGNACRDSHSHLQHTDGKRARTGKSFPCNINLENKSNEHNIDLDK